MGCSLKIRKLNLKHDINPKTNKMQPHYKQNHLKAIKKQFMLKENGKIMAFEMTKKSY